MGRANKSVGGFKDKLKSSIKTIAKWGAAAGVVAIGVGAKVLDLGAKYADMDNKASTVFEDQIGTVRKWASEQAGAIGLTARELTGLTANFADLLKPMGFTAQQAAEMSMQTNELSGALAKWSGGQKTAAEVSEILAKAMLGEREGLKQLGISITEADVKSRLLTKGQEELTGAALEQAKAIATQELIMEKSTDAQTAWAEGQDDLSVRMNKARATVQEFKEKAVEKLLPVVVSLIERGQALVDEWGPPIQKWFGKEGPKALDAAKKALSAAGDAVEWVRKNSEWLIPVLGGLLASIVALKIVNTVTRLYRAWQTATAAQTTAQWLLNGALIANPIGLVIVAVVGLIAAFVIAYKTSETFRNVVKRAFEAVMDGAKRLSANVIGGIRLLVDAFLGFAETMIGAAAKAFGWVPGLGDKLDRAHAEIKGFRERANAEMSAMQTSLRYSADIGPAEREIRRLRDLTRSIPQAATVQFGGTRGGITMHSGGWVPGPSTAEVPAILQGGEFVVSHDMMRRGGGPSGDVNINIGIAGNPQQVADEIAEMLRRREQAMR